MKTVKKPMYRIIKEYLLELVEKQKDDPDFQLPSENQLAIKFGVSRTCAKRALKNLEQEGLICRIQGKGTFLSQNRRAEILNQYQSPVRAEAVVQHIGLFLPSNQSQLFNDISAALQKEMWERNAILHVFYTFQDQNTENFLLQNTQSSGFSGLIICPTDSDIYSPEIMKLSLNRFPTVILDRSLPGLNLSTVMSDHFHSAYETVRFLISKGHRDIYFACGARALPSSMESRMEGFKQGFIDSGVFFDKNFILRLPFHDADELRIKLTEFFSERQPSAMLCPSGLAFEQLSVLARAHARQKIDYILYDNDPPHLVPENHIMLLQNPGRIASSVTEILWDLMTGDAPPQHVIVPFDSVNFQNIRDLSEKRH